MMTKENRFAVPFSECNRPGTFLAEEDDLGYADEPVTTNSGSDRSGEGEVAGVQYQKCGGGRRVLRKRIGGGA